MTTNQEWALKMIPVLVRWAQGTWDVPHSEEAYCWYNTYLIAAYEINPKEKKVCIEERNISWLRVSFILTAIGLAFICMWFIFFHILFA